MKCLKLLALASASAMALSPVWAEGSTTHTVDTMDGLISAVSVATAGDTIVVQSGDYTTTQTISIANGIIVRGETGDPADVRIADSQGSGRRAFTISHADAQVRDLTVSGTGGVTANGGHISISNGRLENCVITGGTSGNKIKGINVYVSGSGIVTNCVISGGRGNNEVNSGANVALAGGLVVDCTIKDGLHTRMGRGSNVYISDGRLVRCRVTGAQGRCDNNNVACYSYGAGIYADGGTVDSCLVQSNLVAGLNSRGAGIYVSGAATVVNCTVVGNSARDANASHTGIGIAVVSDTAKIVNTIVYDNGGLVETEFGTANLDRFYICASSVVNPSDTAALTISSGDFKNYPADLSLNNASALVDAGTESSDWMPTTLSDCDLAGNVRTSGTARDLGSHEIDQSVFSIGGAPRSLAAYEGSNVVFAMRVFGGDAYEKFRWDYGNGTVEMTTEPLHTYAYPTSGLYTVRYSASLDGTTWLDWTTVPIKLVVVPEAIFVDPTCTGSQYPFKTRTTAATSLEAALAAMTNTASANLPCFGTVRLSGTVSATDMTLAYPITIMGDTGDPADAVITDSVTGKRAFMMQHAEAVLKDLTISGSGMGDIEGGHLYLRAGTVDHCVIADGHGKNASADQFGGNIYMTGGLIRRSTISGGYLYYGYPNYACGGNIYLTGGRIEDCDIAGGYTGRKGRGANVFITGGRLVRCSFTGGKADNNVSGNSSYASCCGGVYATGGMIENCLFSGNRASGTGSAIGGVTVKGAARLVNCTVVGNSATTADGVGVAVQSASAKVYNTIVFGNNWTNGMTTVAGEYGTVNLTNYVNCGSGFANEDGENCKVIDATAFTDYSLAGEGIEYLKPSRMAGNPLLNAGGQLVDYTGYGATSTTDLLGLARFVGKRVDIGCMEGSYMPGLLAVFR